MELELKLKTEIDYRPFLQAHNFEPIKKKHQIDRYFLVDETINGQRYWLRLRQDVQKNQYSCDLHRLVSAYATEETEIAFNQEDAKKMQYLLETLGHQVQCVVDKQREVYRKEDVEICLDEVQGLGHFVEIEIQGEENPENIRRLNQLAQQMGLNPKDNIQSGYPEMHVRRGRCEPHRHQ